MNLRFFIARRYLFSRKSHSAINVVTGISVACVGIVTAALIVIMSIMNGLSDLVESLYNSFYPDVRITPVKGKVFAFDPAVVEEIRKMPGVAWYTEIVDENVLIECEDQQLIVTMRGVEDDYATYTRFDTTIKYGKYDLHRNGGISTVAGQAIATKMNLKDGSELQLFVPKRDRNLTVDMSNLDEEPFNRSIAIVSGLYGVSADFDDKYVFLPITEVRKLMDYSNECTSVAIGLKKDADVDATIAAIKKISGTNCLVQSRYQQNQLLFETLKSEKAWSFIILLFILFIATFNTIGSLTLLIIEKKKDIGILWSMGTDPSRIRGIFFLEGLLIS
ncbi:MAG TPA: ABC transporter permease, partial [Bacteroidia bacterium]|nr:ABC transporter permease [Bacteroidia bacterium]